MRSIASAGKCLLALALSMHVFAAAAQSPAAYPNKPVKLIVGFAPGGANDIIARVLAEPLGNALGQPVVVDNRPGANGIVASGIVAKSPSDGYTLLFAGSGPMTINPAIYANLPYDPVREFAPVGIVGTLGALLLARSNLGVTAMSDVIRLAKERPGAMTYGSGSTSFQLAAEMFCRQAGIKLLHVPYKGAGPAVQAAASGEIDLAFVDPSAGLSLAAAGKVLAIALTSEPRPGSMPNLPTMAEAGLPNFDLNFFLAIFAPAGTPAGIVERLNSEIAVALKLPAVREKILAFGIRPISSSPAQLADRVRRDIERFSALAKAEGIAAAAP